MIISEELSGKAIAVDDRAVRIESVAGSAFTSISPMSSLAVTFTTQQINS